MKYLQNLHSAILYSLSVSDQYRPGDSKEEDSDDEHSPEERKKKWFRSIYKIENKRLFRAALRAFNSPLEIFLYANNTDTLNTSYNFPSDDEIKKGFQTLNETYNFFDPTSPDLKTFKTFFKLLKLIGDTIERNNDAENNSAFLHAYKALALFSSSPAQPFKLFDQYLSDHNFFKDEDSSPIHDALIHPLPKNNPSNPLHLVQWRKIILKSGGKAAHLFRMAPKIEEKLREIKLLKKLNDLEVKIENLDQRFNVLARTLNIEWQAVNFSETLDESKYESKLLNNQDLLAPVNYVEAVKIARSIPYKNGNKYPELAQVCQELLIDEEIFDKCLEIEVKRKTTDNLPNVMLNGNDLSLPGYYFVKLPIDDPRAYVLGHLTNCCQSIGAHAEQCVIDCLTSVNSCFYVLLKATSYNQSSPLINNKIDYDNFKIVGQGYAWLSKLGNLVFDSWENRQPELENHVIVPFLIQFANTVTHDNSSILRVTIGRGGRSLWKNAEAIKKIEIIQEGIQYPDSHSQALIAINEARQLELISELELLSMHILGSHHDSTLFNRESIISARQANEIKEILQNSLFLNVEKLVLKPYCDAAIGMGVGLYLLMLNKSSILNFANYYTKLLDRELAILAREPTWQTTLSLLLTHYENAEPLTELFLILRDASLLNVKSCQAITDLAHIPNRLLTIKHALHILSEMKALNEDNLASVLAADTYVNQFVFVLSGPRSARSLQVEKFYSNVCRDDSKIKFTIPLILANMANSIEITYIFALLFEDKIFDEALCHEIIAAIKLFDAFSYISVLYDYKLLTHERLKAILDPNNRDIFNTTTILVNKISKKQRNQCVGMFGNKYHDGLALKVEEFSQSNEVDPILLAVASQPDKAADLVATISKKISGMHNLYEINDYVKSHPSLMQTNTVCSYLRGDIRYYINDTQIHPIELEIKSAPDERQQDNIQNDDPLYLNVHAKLVKLTNNYLNKHNLASDKASLFVNLKNTLLQDDKKSIRQCVIAFEDLLSKADKNMINTHRTYAWVRYVYNALSILSVIPGLVRAYSSYSTFGSMQFWKADSEKAVIGLKDVLRISSQTKQGLH